jgi:signal transduction histidine kinase
LIYLTNEPFVERRDVNVSDLVLNLITDMKPLADKVETGLRNEIDPGMSVNADPALLAEVFQNLVGNAIKFTDRGLITIGAERKEAGIECWVQDSGKGIRKDRLERIFQKFETDSFEGHGLGLAIVKKIVEAHGGIIRAESTPGEGSRFSFTLPQRQTNSQDREAA